MMKKKIVLMVLVLFSGVEAFAQLNFPNPSPDAQVKQEVGFTEVEVKYSRPGVKGRKIFGELVPYGELWRTGAHDATTIRFSEPVELNGNPVPAGTYSLFTIPKQNEWTIILNSETEMHGAAAYAEENDVLRFTVKPQQTAGFYESFTIAFSDVVNNAANINLIWENTQLTFNLHTNADEVVMAEINERINVKKESRASLYYQASMYYFNHDKDLAQALEWIKVANDKSQDFMYLQLQARIEAALGMHDAAIATAQASSQLAKEKEMDHVVLANEELIEEWANNQ